MTHQYGVLSQVLMQTLVGYPVSPRGGCLVIPYKRQGGLLPPYLDAVLFRLKVGNVLLVEEFFCLLLGQPDEFLLREGEFIWVEVEEDLRLQV